MLVSVLMISTSYLFHFHEVVRLGGFLKAAKKLKTGQPNLSRSVKLLEESLGESLMIRTKAGIVLTSAGKELFATSEEVFSKLEEIENQLTHRSTNKTLKIGASENLCIHLLPKFVRAAIQDGICSTVDLYSGTAEEIEARITGVEADFGLFYHQPKSAALKQQVLCEVEFVRVLGKQAKRSDWGSLPYIGSRGSDYSKPYFALEALKKNGIAPRKIIETNSQEAQIRMAIEGVGYTVVPKFMADYFRSQLTFDNTFKARAKLYCVYRKEISPDVLKLLMTYLKKEKP